MNPWGNSIRWAVWALPATLGAAVLFLFAFIPLLVGSWPHLHALTVAHCVALLAIVLGLQPLNWITIAAWLAAKRLLPSIDRSLAAMATSWLAVSLLLWSATVLVWDGGLSRDFDFPVSLAGPLIFSVATLTPRFIAPSLRPGAFSEPSHSWLRKAAA